jgi:hypothetical protein
MRIGLSFVGELASFENATLVDTPDGLRGIRPMLVDELQRRGHTVYALQKRLEAVPYSGVVYDEGFPDLDVLFCEFRWETYKGKTPDLDRQDELLKRYSLEIPTIILDAAYWIDDKFEEKWPQVIIADPGIDPKFITRKRDRMLFWTDRKALFEVKDPDSLFTYGYIGNDYFRPDEFRRYYVEPSCLLRDEGVQTMIYGNWIQKSAARPDPGKLISMSHDIGYGGRWSFRDSMKILSNFVATTHICKPEYYSRGNITIRFAESIKTGTPGLVPWNFRDPYILGREWTVQFPEDVVAKVALLKRMTQSERLAVVQYQKETLMSRHDVSVETAVSYIESKAK